MSRDSPKFRQRWRQQGGMCWVCGQPMRLDDVTREHVIPKSVGGNNNWRNLALSHGRCNEARGSSFSRVEVVRFEAMTGVMISARRGVRRLILGARP